MKNNLYKAKEIIELFEKELNFKMSEANFAKHKKAKIFKIYEKEGKKGDYFKFPEAAIDFFDQVNQRNQMGWKAIDNLDVYLKEYKVKEELENRVDKQWDRLLKVPKITIDIFDIKGVFDTEEELEDFKHAIDEYNMLNHDRCRVFVKVIQDLVGEYSDFNNTILQHDMIKSMANQLTLPSDIVEVEGVKLIEGVEIEYSKVCHL